jgi:hypothetical protein
MSDLNQLYIELKFWLPVVTAFTIVVKAYLGGKGKISDWADQLLNNHLSHIETATTSTEVETKKTNELLRTAAERDIATASKVDAVQSTLHTQHERQLEVWHGVTQALTVLKERTRVCSRTPKKVTTPKKRVRNG